jgi:hypothetical protein
MYSICDDLSSTSWQTLGDFDIIADSHTVHRFALLSNPLVFPPSRFLSLSIILNFSFQPLPRNIRNRNQKFDKNVTKRGNVSVGKAAEHEDDFPVSKTLIMFFLVVVVGSSLVQVFNLFGKAPALE